MREDALEISMPDGSTEAFLYRPEDARRFPGVIYLPDIGGIRETNRGMARRLADNGYTVLMPNLFYRTTRLPAFDFPFRAGEERSVKRMQELRGPLTPEAVDRDASAYVDYLAANSSVGPGPFGVVGFCFAGAVAMRFAA